MYICKALVTYTFFLTVVSAALSPTLDTRTANPVLGLRPRGNLISADRFKTPAAGPNEKKYTSTKCSGYRGFACERRCKCKTDGTLKCNHKYAQEMRYIILPSQRLRGMDVDSMVGDPNPDVTGICAPMCLCRQEPGVWAFAHKPQTVEDYPHEALNHNEAGRQGSKNLGHLVFGPLDAHTIDIGPADPSHSHTPSTPARKSADSGRAGPSSPYSSGAGPSDSHVIDIGPADSSHPHIPSNPARKSTDSARAGPSSPYSSGAGPSNPSSQHPHSTGPGPSDSFAKHFYSSVAGPSDSFAQHFYSSGVMPLDRSLREAIPVDTSLHKPDSSGAGPSNASH